MKEDCLRAGTETVARRIHVAVVDDDRAIRCCLEAILKSSQGFELAGAFSTAAEAISHIPRLQPHVTLMDIGLPDLSGIECTRRLKQIMPGLKILMLSGQQTANLIDASLEAGALAYLVKPFNLGQFMATLRVATLRTSENFNQNGAGRIPNSAHSRGHLPLSPRERQVLIGLADGLLYKEISDKLSISYSAVHKYQNQIFKKLGVSNRSEAIKLWFQHFR